MLKSLGKILGAVLRLLGGGWRRMVCGLSNARRRLLRRRLPDYVVMELSGELLERKPDQPWYYAYLPGRETATSIEGLADGLRAVARDPDVRGVLLLVRGLSLSLAQAQSMHALFERFRQWDRRENGQRPGWQPKRIVIHLEMGGNGVHAMAAGGDQLFLTPESDWSVTGLLGEQTYLADSLAHLGVHFEVVKIAPWKTAFDRFQRNEISPEAEAQTNWLLDSLYEDLVDLLAAHRNLPPDDVRASIDAAPLNGVEAMNRGLIDDLCYEDELPARLGREGKEATLQPYRKIRRLLYRKPRPPAKGRIGVISMTGSIMPGKSRTFPVDLPLLGSHTLGSSTAQQQIRAAIKDESLSAVVLHVDSPGGSALASDLIWRELTLLARRKPLVVYMGDVAASGGYYISAPGQRIVAQSATLTGSIGVITGKPVTQESYTKLHANRYSFHRGQNADLFSDSAAWSPEQRAQIERNTVEIYETFKQRVAQGRKLEYASLDPICQGRVWTGRQALAHGLVDVNGDFFHAVAVACDLAKLPTDGSVPITTVSAGRTIMPISAKAPDHEGESLIAAALALLQGDWRSLLGQEIHWFWADGLFRTK